MGSGIQRDEGEGPRISCGCWTVTVYAENEDEVRRFMAEEEPGKVIDKITRVEEVEDEDEHLL